MSGLDTASAWRVLKELNVTSAVLDIITFLTAEPVTATLQEQTLQLARMVFASVTALELVHAKVLWLGRNVHHAQGDSLGFQR